MEHGTYRLKGELAVDIGEHVLAHDHRGEIYSHCLDVGEGDFMLIFSSRELSNRTTKKIEGVARGSFRKNPRKPLLDIPIDPDFEIETNFPLDE